MRQYLIGIWLIDLGGWFIGDGPRAWWQPVDISWIGTDLGQRDGKRWGLRWGLCVESGRRNLDKGGGWRWMIYLIYHWFPWRGAERQFERFQWFLWLIKHCIIEKGSVELSLVWLESWIRPVINGD